MMALLALIDAAQKTGIKSTCRIGSCRSPSPIASATCEELHYARELNTEVGNDTVPFKREHHKLGLV